MVHYYLRKWGDPILRQKCLPVEDFTDLKELIDCMYSIMIENKGEGIAAPQVGDNRQVIIAYIDNAPKIMINPNIKKMEGYTFSLEGCLSFPGIITPNIRKKSIEVEYQTERGEKRRNTFIDGDAIVLQHEIDHLNGKLIFHYFI